MDNIMSITKLKNQDTNVNIVPDSNTNMEKNHHVKTESLKEQKKNKDIALDGCKEDKPANNICLLCGKTPLSGSTCAQHNKRFA